MARLEFIDGEPPIIRVSGDFGPEDELQGNEYEPFLIDYVFRRDKEDIGYKPNDGEKCYVIAVYDKKKIVVVEWVFHDLDLVANGLYENRCLFKTREEAERIATGIERETNGEFFIDRRVGENGKN